MNLRETLRGMFSAASVPPSEPSVIPEEQEPSRVYQLVTTQLDALQQERDRAAVLEEQEKAQRLEPLREGVEKELDRITQEVTLQMSPTLNTIQFLEIIESLEGIVRIPQLKARETGMAPKPFLDFVIQLSKEGEEEPLFIPGPRGDRYLDLHPEEIPAEEFSLLTNGASLRGYIQGELYTNLFHIRRAPAPYLPSRFESRLVAPFSDSILEFDETENRYDFLTSLKVERAAVLNLSLHWNTKYAPGPTSGEGIGGEERANNFIHIDFKQVNGKLYLHLYGAPKYSEENWLEADSLDRERLEKLIAAEVVRQIEIGAQPIVRIGPAGKSGRSKIFNKDLQISGEMVPFFPEDWGHF